ncbi:MAG: hypothetical protein IT367_21590 [Candidatus Hydrogenedentes bacterium]|nr:hypothetical protein [Candidatus Hydrogenedentota bacterium]
MKSLQKNWIMWAVLFLVVITLFGPSAVAYAAPAPTPAFRSILQEITYYCSSIGNHL